MGQNRIWGKVYAADGSSVMCDLEKILKYSVFQISHL